MIYFIPQPMTDAPIDVDPDASIAEYQQRLDTIIEQLEDGTVSLERAQTLHTEGTALIEVLEDELVLREDTVTEQP